MEDGREDSHVTAGMSMDRRVRKLVVRNLQKSWRGLWPFREVHDESAWIPEGREILAVSLVAWEKEHFYSALPAHIVTPSEVVSPTMFPHRAALCSLWGQMNEETKTTQGAKCEDAIWLSMLSEPSEGASDSALEEDNIREGFSEEATVGWGRG